MDKVTMSKKELRRVEVIAQLEAGTLKTKEASELLGLSERQVKRLRRTYRKKGAVGLAHGNRGKASPRRTEAHIREQVVELVTEKYQDYNTEKSCLKLVFATLWRASHRWCNVRMAEFEIQQLRLLQRELGLLVDGQQSEVVVTSKEFAA